MVVNCKGFQKVVIPLSYLVTMWVHDPNNGHMCNGFSLKLVFLDLLCSDGFGQLRAFLLRYSFPILSARSNQIDFSNRSSISS